MYLPTYVDRQGETFFVPYRTRATAGHYQRVLKNLEASTFGHGLHLTVLA